MNRLFVKYNGLYSVYVMSLKVDMQNNDLRLEGIKCEITFQQKTTPNVQLKTNEKTITAQ